MFGKSIAPGLFVLFLSYFLGSFSAEAQFNQVDILMPWSGEFTSASLHGQEIKLPAIPFDFNSEGIPIYSYKKFEKGIGQFEITLSVESSSLAEASNFDREFVKSQRFQVSDEVKFSYRVASDRGKSFLGLDIEPYVMQNGVLKRVQSIRFSVDLKPKPEQNANQKFLTNSAMSSGSWYKLGINNSGVYKLDFDFLQKSGIQVSGLNVNHFHVFGNGIGMLPENNGLERPDDLLNNAIAFVGDGDNIFEQGEYFLFFAKGPNEVRLTGQRLTEIKHLYASESHYFICIDANKTPKRIQSFVQAPGAVSYNSTGSNQVLSYEKDERKYEDTPSGKRWYGELFDFVLSYDFNFNLSGVITSEPVEIRTIYAQSGLNSGSLLKMFVNNSSTPSHQVGVPSSLTYTSTTFNHSVSGSNLALKLELDRNNPSTKVFLDKIEINYRRNLNYTGGQFFLRDIASIGQTTGYAIQTSLNNMKIWEFSEAGEVSQVNYTFNNGLANFQGFNPGLSEFVLFTDASTLTPTFLGAVQNQNLHALPRADYLIVTHPDFLNQAERLAELHRADGWIVHVANVNHIYNEFSSGMQDPVAIRWFAKMFYDRANQSGEEPPLNLCLFGDGSYDPLDGRSPGNNNKIVTYQTDNSESYTASVTSDGFFVLLDNNEEFNGSDGMDMGVGRILASSNDQAKILVDKIEHYKKFGSSHFNASGSLCQASEETTRGDWQLVMTHIADDEDGGQFVNDHEGYIEYYQNLFPEYNTEKIYLDAYQQVSTSGGQRYPDVPIAIDSRVERGNLVMNYVGHGGETGLSYERVVTIPQIEEWRNIDKMMLFVSATCEFTRFDDFSRLSAGEVLYLSPKGGAVSMMTTTRAVFISVNSIVGAKLYENLFLRDDEQRPITMGEIVQNTINTSNSFGNSVNRRAFMLLGDPMLRLALPGKEYNIVIDSINGLDPNIVQDTLRSLSKVKIHGHLEDAQGNIASNLNGFLSPTIFDKPKSNQTLGQDPGSPVKTFETQRNIIFKGKSSVNSGQFNFEFVVPKDIDYSFGNGKLSLFFNNNQKDAAASETRFKVGGVDPNGVADAVGPEINLYLNNPNFVSGGMTNETPVFFAKLFDENGINAVGNGIGHDITLVLDGNSSDPFVLNDYYEADVDSYQSGMVRFQMPRIAEGPHTLTFKVWDVNNNSSEFTIEFVVQSNTEIGLSHVLNYPNPFTTRTEFYFEHNQSGQDLDVQIQIFTISGRVVRTINESLLSCGFRSPGIEWDGRDEFGDQLARGTYIYRLSVTLPSGERTEKIEKLVLLR